MTLEPLHCYKHGDMLTYPAPKGGREAEFLQIGNETHPRVIQPEMMILHEALEAFHEVSFVNDCVSDHIVFF